MRELYAVGLRHRDSGNWREALDAFELVRAKEEQEPEEAPRRWWNLGMTLHEIASIKVKLGQLTESAELYARARAAKERCSPDARDWNQFSITLHEQGYVHSELGHKAEALACLEAALSANRMIDDVTLRRAADAATFHVVAHIHLGMKSWAKAEAALAGEVGALDEPQRRARALYWRAFAQIELQQWEAAEASAKESLGLYEANADGNKNANHHADVLAELAHVARHRGDRDVAAKCLRAARALRRA